MELWRRIGYGLLGLVAIATLTVTLILVVAWRRDAAATIESIAQAPEAPRVGETVSVTAVVRLPWHRRPTATPKIDLPDGINRGRDVEATVVGYGPGSLDWQVQLSLIPVDFGPFENLEAAVPLTPQRDGGDSSAKLTIKAIAPVARYNAEEEADVTFAGNLLPPPEEEPVPPRWPWIVTAILALLLLAALIFRRRHSDDGEAYVPPPPPPWETAQLELQALEAALPMEPDKFFVRLVDLLRQYLERAYHLPATEQTTVEFLQAMQSTPGLLSGDHRALLEEVIRAADVVKFARTDASDEQMRGALAKARSFVVESAQTLQSGPATAEASDA